MRGGEAPRFVENAVTYWKKPRSVRSKSIIASASCSTCRRRVGALVAPQVASAVGADALGVRLRAGPDLTATRRTRALPGDGLAVQAVSFLVVHPPTEWCTRTSS